MDPWLAIPADRRRRPSGLPVVLCALVALGLIVMLTRGGEPAAAPQDQGATAELR